MDILSSKDLLLKQAGDANSEVRWKTADFVYVNFQRTGKVLREELLKKFLNDLHPGVRMKAAEIASQNFLFIDKHLRNGILEKSASDSYFNVRKKAVEAIAKNIENIETEILNRLLSNLENDENPSVRTAVVRLFDDNFDYFFKSGSGEVERLLEKFCGDESLEVKTASAEVFVKHFDSLSVELGKNLARELAGKNQPQVIERLVVLNGKLPEDLRKIFKELKHKKLKRAKKREALRDITRIQQDADSGIELMNVEHEGDLEVHGIKEIPVRFMEEIAGSRLSPGVKRTLAAIIAGDSKLGGVMSDAIRNSEDSKTQLADVLKSLLEHGDPAVRISASNLINKNFYIIPLSVSENLLKSIANDPDADVRKSASDCIVRNFSQVSLPLQEELFGKLIADNDSSVRSFVHRIVNRNFSRLLRNVKGELLIALLKKYSGDYTLDLINLKFGDLSNDKKHEIIKVLSDGDPEAKKIASDIVFKNFDGMPRSMHEGILKVLANGDSYAKKIAAGIISDKFDDLSMSVREEILRKLIDDPDECVRACTIDALCSNFDDTKKYSRISERLFGSWLKRLIESENEKDRGRAANVIAKNWHAVSGEFREDFKRLAKDESSFVRENTAAALNKNFNSVMIAENEITVNEFIKNFAQDSGSIVRAIAAGLTAKNYKNLLPETQNFINILSSDGDSFVRASVANAIVSNYNNLPPDVREKLKALANDDSPEVLEEIGNLLASGEENLPDNLISEFSGEIRKIVRHRKNKDDITGLYDISITKKYTLDLINLKFNDLTGDKQHEIIEMLAHGDPHARKIAADIISKNFNLIPRDLREEILMKLVDDTDKDVKNRAIEALCSNFSDTRKYCGMKELLFESWMRGLIASSGVDDSSKAAYIIAKNWNVVSDEFKDEFEKLAGDKSPLVRNSVVTAITDNFNSLNINTQNKIIQRLAGDSDASVRANTAKLIAKHYKNVSAETQNLLTILSKDEDSGGRASAAIAIVSYYKNLPWEVCEKLKTLAKDTSSQVKSELGRSLGWEEKNLPKDLINEFPEEIQKIAEKSRIEEDTGGGKTKVKFQKMKIKLFRR